MKTWLRAAFKFRLHFKDTPERFEFEFSIGWAWILLPIVLIVLAVHSW